MKGLEGRRGLHDQASQRLSGERVSALVERHAAGSAQPTPTRLTGSWDPSTIWTPALSHVETRRVANDYTIRFQGKRYQIDRKAIVPGLRGGKVRLERPAGRQPRGALRQARAGVEAAVTRAPSPGTPKSRPLPLRPRRLLVKLLAARAATGWRVSI